MKTINDLKNLIPTIVGQISRANHEIGENDECTVNCYTYDENGWLIEVTYECCGDWEYDSGDYWTPPSGKLLSASGTVLEITACHYDEETDEETEFGDEAIDGLWKAIDKALENIA
ncbi:MAG: hypothetical protein HUK14_06155 [Muribaculaceae bacterium]|nr:hypothetical protein [Muribaculaceae bacterium]